MAAQSRVRRGWLIPVCLVMAGLLAVWWTSHKVSLQSGRDRWEVESSLIDHQPPTSVAGIGDAAPSYRGLDAPLAVSRRWGSGDDALGRTRPEQGNPEAPMSFAVTREGNLVVVDQVNGRLVRIDRNGRTAAIQPLTERVPQDVALGPRGETAILDRLGDRAVT